MNIEPFYRAVCERLAKACVDANRPETSVRLLAVSKKHPVSAISALLALGHRDFAENYWQEARDKQAELVGEPITWHFIGQLQRNKARYIAKAFDWVHSVPSIEVAAKLNQYRPDDVKPLNICLQMNLEAEETKQGFDEAELESAIRAVLQLPRLALRGLMCLPEPQAKDSAACSPAFVEMQRLFNDMGQQFPELPWDTLSMGMSADLEQAVACGSTCIRVGTALFGSRT